MTTTECGYTWTIKCHEHGNHIVGCRRPTGHVAADLAHGRNASAHLTDPLYPPCEHVIYSVKVADLDEENEVTP